ncbi:DUF1828 domain-containing protein [Gracilimonas sp.]|uniref:DUF1828 domain-containing protein n=1 Tax=Gracilimonas sp. TaxID=1974203 RepID=UPI003BACF627
MSCSNIIELINSTYFKDWHCKPIERNIETYQLVTNRLLPNDDCVEIVIEKNENEFTITDNGELVSLLYMFGIDIGENYTQNKLDEIRIIGNHYNIDFVNDEFITKATEENLSYKINMIIEAISEASSLIYQIKEYSRSDFKSRVVKYFKSQKTKVYEDYKVAGVKMEHTIDLRLNGTNEVLSKTISEVHSYKLQILIERAWYSFNDIQKNDRVFKPLIIYNDSTEEFENAWTDHHFQQLSAEGISAMGITSDSEDIQSLAIEHRL